MASFSFKFKNFDNVNRMVKKVMDDIVNDSAMQKEIADKLVDLTQKTIRSGKSPDAKGGEAKTFPRISEGWSERKEDIKGKNQVSPYYRKGRSNLTFTGQLVDSIESTVTKGKKGSAVKIHPTGTRKPYYGKKGNPLKSESKSNDEVMTSLKKRGFYALGVTYQMINIVNKLVRSAITKKLKELKK